MNKKIFDPKKYGMATCPFCHSHGFIQDPERQCCPTCGGFGFIKKEAEQDTNISIDSESKILSGLDLSGDGKYP